MSHIWPNRKQANTENQTLCLEEKNINKLNNEKRTMCTVYVMRVRPAAVSHVRIWQGVPTERNEIIKHNENERDRTHSVPRRTSNAYTTKEVILQMLGKGTTVHYQPTSHLNFNAIYTELPTNSVLPLRWWLALLLRRWHLVIYIEHLTCALFYLSVSFPEPRRNGP